MTLSINNPAVETYIFIIIFLAAVLILTRRRREKDFFPPEATHELKGLAILAIIFSHIGYFLIPGQNFLFPLSVAAGVGVNLFLFLSGYGLTASSIKNKFSLRQFYRRRLIKLYLPLWLSLLIFFLLDHLALGQAYGLNYVGQSFLGFFPRADLFMDVNSPLWYFTFILFYYLLFPIAFSLKNHRLSALAVYLVTYLIIFLNPGFLNQVMPLYSIHTLAFPLGMLLASLRYEPNNFLDLILARTVSWAKTRPRWFKKIGYWLSVVILLTVLAYTAYYSNIGGELKEELTSLITMSALVILFLIKKVNFGIFHVFGILSYEIYLLHWPILSRYEMFYRVFPAWLATALYLVLFLILGLALNRFSGIILSQPRNKKNINRLLLKNH